MSRPVWILPDNSSAEFPFVQATPSNKKGLLIECRAIFAPISQTFAGSLGSGYQTAKVRRIEILNKNLRLKPSSVASGNVTLNGTTTYYRTLTNNAFVFIKKPTMIYTPSGAKSTQTGVVTNPYINVTFSDKGVASHEPAFGFRYTDDPTKYYLLSDLNDGFGELFNFFTTWSETTATIPVAQGKQINLAITQDYDPAYPNDTVWSPYPTTYYVGSKVDVSIDMNNSFNPNNHTVVYDIQDVSAVAGFTTLDVPSWVVGPDTTRTKEGWQGYVEYSDILAGLTADYDDYTPADFF